MQRKSPKSPGTVWVDEKQPRNQTLGTAVLRATRQALNSWLTMLPILLGVLLLMSLLAQLLPSLLESGVFGVSTLADAALGSGLGSIAAGQPVVSYLLAGELSAAGVSRVGVTALVVAWVTVGFTHLPMEAQAFGWRFALVRNLFGFVLAILIAFLVVGLSGGF